MSGSPSWTRTNDLGINSPALYQLSYRGTGAGAPNSSAAPYVKALRLHKKRPGGPERNRTAVEGFADPCLTTRPPDPTTSLSGHALPGSSTTLAPGRSRTYKGTNKG